MADFAQITQLMVVILLAVVGALLIWLHWRFTSLKSSQNKMPMLANVLRKSMEDAMSGLTQLRLTTQEAVPQLDDKLQEVHKTIQELDFMMDRAEKVLGKIEQAQQAGSGIHVSQTKNKETYEPVSSYEGVRGKSESVHVQSEGVRDHIKQVPPQPAKPARMATPKQTIAAYGQASTVVQKNMDDDTSDGSTISDVEKELRQVLLGRL